MADELAEVMQRIQMYLYTRRVRCQEFFTDADPLRCGRCTEAFFARALNMAMAGLHLSEAEVQMLIEHFTEHGPKIMPPQVVSYRHFCMCVDEVFASEERQEGLKAATLTSSPGSTVRSTFVPNDVEDEERFTHILHRVAALCKARGVQLKVHFTDLDRAPIPAPSMLNARRGGKVTREQFRRNWPFKKELSMEEIELLAERYTTKAGDVHYMALHNEVSEVMGDPAQPFPTSPLHLRPDETAWSHGEVSVVDRVRAKVAEKKVRLVEHFQDFDPLRKGFCTPGQLKTVFTIMNLSKEIDKHDFEALLSSYMGDNGLFNYTEFCRDVDSAFTIAGLERSPLAMLDMPDASTTSPARRNTMRLEPARSTKIGRLEDKLRSFVRKRRVEMKPMFQDFDKAHRGYVSRLQFTRIASTMGLDLDEKAIHLLCSSYCDFGNHNDFNYTRFIKAVDPPLEDVEVAMTQMTSPFVAWKPHPYFDKGGKVIRRTMSTPML